MAIQYGINILSSDIRNILEKNNKQQSGVRTWRQLFGNASLGYENQADSLKSYYSDVMAQAYKSNLAQQNNIMGAGLNVGATNELISLTRQNLQDAYNNYIKNYAANLNTAATAYSKEIDAISQALTERADNFAKLYNYAYNYLSEELSSSVDSTGKTYLDANDMSWMYEGEGIDRKLASWNNIASKLKNDDGSLNEQGKAFFDQIFNARPEGFKNDTGDNTKTFGEWLSEKDNDLYNWLVSQDLFNYTFAGTNLGTAKVIIGRDSTNDVYNKENYIDITDMEAFANLNIDDKKVLDSVAALDAAKKAYEDGLARGQKIKYNPYRDLAYYDVIKLKGSVEVAKKNAVDEWKSYQKKVNEQYTKLTDLFKSKISSETYSKFNNDNEALLAEFTDTVNKMKQSELPSKYLIDKCKELYNKIYNNMMSVLKQKSDANKRKIIGL